MAFLNTSNGVHKIRSLVDALAQCDRRRRYYLSLVTCYCNPVAFQTIIDSILERDLNIAAIYLYIDRRNAISIGVETLRTLEHANPDLLSIYAVKGSRLFHTKGYCLAAYDASGYVARGTLALGSANLTRSGLTSQAGNTESLVVITDASAIEDFLSYFEDENNLLTLDQLNSYTSNDEIDFRYALLKLGMFSHKWSANIVTYFSVRYDLNENGRKRAQDGIPLGFQVEAASIGKKYFDFEFDHLQPHDTNLVRNFGIECFLGHWIPKSIIEDEGRDEHNETFTAFKLELFSNFDSQIGEINQRIISDYKTLLREQLIDEIDVDPRQRFHEKFDNLKHDDAQLYRIWTGRYFFELPYDSGDIENIHKVYKDMCLTISRRQHKNSSMRALLAAVENLNFESFDEFY